MFNKLHTHDFSHGLESGTSGWSQEFRDFSHKGFKFVLVFVSGEGKTFLPLLFGSCLLHHKGVLTRSAPGEHLSARLIFGIVYMKGDTPLRGMSKGEF
jgi:hypothetical protein